MLEGLEVGVTLDALVLLEVTMDRDRREVVLTQDLVKEDSSLDTGDENDDLVEL